MLAMFCIRACSGLVGCRTATRALSLHSVPGITMAQVGLWYCVHVWCIMMENISSKFSCHRPVYLMRVADRWRGSQTAGAEGSVRRRWWKTSVCPQDGKGKATELLYSRYTLLILPRRYCNHCLLVCERNYTKAIGRILMKFGRRGGYRAGIETIFGVIWNKTGSRKLQFWP